MDEQAEIREKIERLREEHGDLDAVIRQIAETPPFDELRINRLKKKKLQLKDQISLLEDQLIPDIIA